MRINATQMPRRARLEMVPMIDVIFLLLVFFIYVTLWSTAFRGVPVRLPRGVADIEPRQPLVITLREDGSLWVKQRSVSMREAVEEAALAEQRGARPVLVRGDRRAALGTAVELLSRLRAAGVQQVSFQVQPEP